MTVITTSTRGIRGAVGSTGAAGATGTAGTNGTNGAGILHYDDTIVGNSTNGIVSLNSYTIPAAGLAAKGDAIKMSASIDIDTSAGVKYAYVYMNGVVAHTVLSSDFILEENVRGAHIECYMTRRSDAEEILCRFKVSMYNEFYQLVKEEFFVQTLIVNDLTTSTNTISVLAKATGAGDEVSVYEFVITKYKI